MKRLEQFALLYPLQIARLFFDIPEMDVGQTLQRPPSAVLDPARPGSNTAHPSRRPPKKTYQAVRLSQRKGLQDDGFRFPGRHELSARRRLAGHIADLRPIRVHTQN